MGKLHPRNEEAGDWHPQESTAPPPSRPVFIPHFPTLGPGSSHPFPVPSRDSQGPLPAGLPPPLRGFSSPRAVPLTLSLQQEKLHRTLQGSFYSHHPPPQPQAQEIRISGVEILKCSVGRVWRRETRAGLRPQGCYAFPQEPKYLCLAFLVWACAVGPGGVPVPAAAWWRG